VLSSEDSFDPLAVSLSCGGAGPAAAAITPVPPEGDYLTCLCEPSESATDRGRLRIVGDALPCRIGLNIEGEHRKFDRVDRPVLLCESIQKTPLHGTRPSTHDKCSDLRTIVRS
jgi:hypothetical protein